MEKISIAILALLGLADSIKEWIRKPFKILFSIINKRLFKNRWLIMSIKLQKYNKKIITQSMMDGYDLSVNDNVGGPDSIIDRSNYNSNMQPIMILNDDQLVGCFCLHVKDGPLSYGGNYETDILVRAFSIDVNFRRRGYALVALLELNDFVRDNYYSIERIILAVNHDNLAAQALYSKAGFVDTGKRTESHLGEIYIFNKNVL